MFESGLSDLLDDELIAELVRREALYFCWVCHYLSNSPQQHYHDGCINCMGKCE